MPEPEKPFWTEVFEGVRRGLPMLLGGLAGSVLVITALMSAGLPEKVGAWLALASGASVGGFVKYVEWREERERRGGPRGPNSP